ncbi:MAG: hypothetical protein M3280_10760 [Actinomycetota bacterium]|nr:hypothetical protein [Actinomycetota bacterium]
MEATQASLGYRGDTAKRLRLGLAILAVPILQTGAWALFAPRSWYDDFPGRGLGWIAAFGDYNEHFLQDIGSAHLAFGALLVWAAIVLHKKAITAALFGFLVFAVPHFAIHVFVREELSTNGYVGTLAILGIGIALSVWLLFLSRKLTST